MKRSLLIVASVLLVATVSCGKRKNPLPPLSPYAQTILTDKTDPTHKALVEWNARDSEGQIFVLGTVDEVRAMSEYLQFFDAFDNVDASAKRDLLPDLSGETIGRAVLINPVFLKDTGMVLRDRCLQAALSALDTIGGKPRGKAVILSDDALCAYIRYDLDSLVRAFEIDGAFFSPIALSLDKALEQGFRRIAVVSSQPLSVYRLLAGKDSSAIVGAASPEAVKDSAFAAFEGMDPDALLACDAIFGPDSLSARLPLIKIIDPREETAAALFKAMRRRNCFTHKVSYPVFQTWVVTGQSDGTFRYTGTDE